MRTTLVATLATMGIAQFLLVATVNAEPRTWEAAGKVTGITGDPSAITGYPVKIGDVFIIRNTFDSDLGSVTGRVCETSAWNWTGVIIETEFRVGRWRHIISSQVLPGSNPNYYNDLIRAHDDCFGWDQYGMYMEDWYGPPSNPRLILIFANWNIGKWSPSTLITGPQLLSSPPDIRLFKPLDGDDMQITLDNFGGTYAAITGKLERLRDVTKRN